MCKFKAMKFRIKNKAQFEELKTVLLQQGYEFTISWKDNLGSIFAEEDGQITWNPVHGGFNEYSNQEMDTAEFIKHYSKPTLQRHKHYDVIVAAAEGKTIQQRSDTASEWKTYEGRIALQNLSWNLSYEYRIKPEPVEMWKFAYGLAGDKTATTVNYYPDEKAFRGSNVSLDLEWVVKLEPTRKLVELE